MGNKQQRIGRGDVRGAEPASHDEYFDIYEHETKSNILTTVCMHNLQVS